MKKFNNYNYTDGICHIYEESKSNITDFGAKKNTNSLKDMKEICPLAYKEKSMRNEDIEFAESLGKSLSMKIKTRLVNFVMSNHKVIIGKCLYDIIKIDSDKENRDLYLYLVKVREVG